MQLYATLRSLSASTRLVRFFDFFKDIFAFIYFVELTEIIENILTYLEYITLISLICMKVTYLILAFYWLYYVLSIDTEKPVIQSAFTNMSVITDPDLPTAIVTWDAVTATDNSGLVTLTSTHQSGSAFPIGDSNVVYTAIDQSGNVAKSRFFVIVEGNFVL